MPAQSGTLRHGWRFLSTAPDYRLITQLRAAHGRLPWWTNMGDVVSGSARGFTDGLRPVAEQPRNWNLAGRFL